MAEKKGKKLRRANAASRAYYGAQTKITALNARKRLVRHLRDLPADWQALKLHEKRYGPLTALKATERGRKRIRRREVLDNQKAALVKSRAASLRTLA